MDILSLKRKLIGRPFRDNWGGSDGNGSDPSAGYSGGVNPSTGLSRGGWSSSDVGPPAPTMADPNVGPQPTAPEPAPAAGDQTVEGYADVSSWGIKPAWYDADNPGFGEKLNDWTSPDPSSLAFRLGIRGLGVTEDHETPMEKYDRMSLVGKFIERVGKTFIPAPLMMAGQALAAYDSGKPLGDVIKDGLFDYGTSKVAGAINGEVAKAVGPDVSQAIGAYNTVAGLANMGSPGTLPGINLGRMATDRIKSGLGIGTNAGAPSGLTNPATGESISNFQSGGWSGGSRTGSNGTPAIDVSAPAAPANVVDALNTNMRFSFDGAGMGRAIRAGASKRGY